MFVLPAYICVHCVPGASGVRRGCQIWNGVTDDCEPLFGCWEPSWSPLQGKRALSR